MEVLGKKQTNTKYPLFRTECVYLEWCRSIIRCNAIKHVIHNTVGSIAIQCKVVKT